MLSDYVVEYQKTGKELVIVDDPYSLFLASVYFQDYTIVIKELDPKVMYTE